MMPACDGLRLREHASDDRAEVSAFIRDRFYRSYGADLVHLMPRLFSLSDEAGALIAAFGLRDAVLERLFMERYLDRPVETVISLHHGADVPRSAIVEIGNLATQPGGARAVIRALTCHLHEQGVQWITFTGVTALRAAFTRLGLRPVTLAEADPARLSATELMSWGRYFTARPVVMGGYVPGGFERLQGIGAEGGPGALVA
jgi:hypothetical protein